MYYTIYKITNTINNKIYIGKHQTNNLDDGYMGSGKHLKRAIDKYGIDKFQKEIIHIFDSEQKMSEKEKELVTEEFVQRKDTYNICIGGKGGFGYINEHDLLGIEKRRLNAQKMHNIVWNSFSHRQKMKNVSIKNGTSNNIHLRNLNPFLGKHHTEESKRKIGEANSKHQSGNKNSQFGTMWITNGIENRKIKKDVDIIPEGWYKGRNI